MRISTLNKNRDGEEIKRKPGQRKTAPRWFIMDDPCDTYSCFKYNRNQYRQRQIFGLRDNHLDNIKGIGSIGRTKCNSDDRFEFAPSPCGAGDLGRSLLVRIGSIIAGSYA